MIKKLLIIGGSGLVGSTLTEYALPHFKLHLTNNENEIRHKGIPVTKIDLLKEREDIIHLIKIFKPDVTVHTVAFAGVDFCESSPHMADLLHVDITRDIAQICNEINSKLIYFSTDAVFDGSLKKKYSEVDCSNPISHYGKTKLNAEKIILEESPQNVILRTTVVYGWHIRSRFTNWVLSSLKNKNSVPAFTDQHNTPTLVDDLAKSIIKIIEMDTSGLYHAVGKTCLSRYEFALRLADGFGFDKNLIIPTLSSEKKQIAPRPSNGCLDGSKLEKLIGYDFCDIDSGISFMLDKSQKHSQVF